MATDFLGSLLVKITGDTGNLDKKIDQSEKSVVSFSKRADAAGKTLTRKLTLPLGLLGAAALKATSDLGESANAVNVVFGDAANTIQRFGDTAAESVGLSQASFNELATIIGAQLKQSGVEIDKVADQTVDLTQRAADLASVFNTDVSDAAGALGAALRGESEPARRFGINISDAAVQAEALASGLVRSKDEINDQIKVQARYALILKQSEQVAGDFANTSDSLANKTRITKAQAVDLAAELGTSLIPLAEDLLSVAQSVIGGFSDLNDGTKKLIVTVGLIAAAAGPAITAIKSIGVALTFLSANPVGAAILALGTLAGILVVVEENFVGVQAVAKDTGTKINDAAFELNKSIQDYLAGEGVIEDFADDVDRLSRAYGISRQQLIQATEEQVVFKVIAGAYKREKTCQKPKNTFIDVMEMYMKQEPVKDYPVVMKDTICSLLDDGLSHVEFHCDNGAFKIVQKDIYSGAKIEVEKIQDGMFAVPSKLPEKLPIGMRTVDFKALFTFQDQMTFYFQDDPYIHFRNEKGDFEGKVAP